MSASEIDPDQLALFQLRVWGYKQGELVSLLIHLGDRLGLYRSLAGAGPVTAGELSESTGLHARWLLEWLRGQSAAGLVEHREGDRFELSPEGTAVLADEEGSLAFAAGAFGSPTGADVVEALCEAFRTGVGLPYDRLGPNAVHATERSLGPWARLALLDRILPALEDVVDKLGSGARVLDVGCGAGVALTTMAGAFPESSFEGIDPSRLAVARAAERIAEAGLTNVEVRSSRAEELAGGDYDLVLTFDCLHDMTRPAEAIAAVRRVVADDGTWLAKDIRCAPTLEENLSNPMLALLYGFSVTCCMSSALSEPGGAGLGTVGLPPQLLEEMAEAAGFSRFRIHDFDDPANLYYEVRP
ncbi:MAG: class I SAM-dependent methyltransferase [Acidimicrobiales bacterium]